MELWPFVMSLLAVYLSRGAESQEFGESLREDERQSPLANLEQAWLTFVNYMRDHNKPWTFSAITGFQNYQQNALFLQTAAQDNHTFHMDLNLFADWSQHQHSRLLGARPPPVRIGVQETGDEVYFTRAVAPASVDYRTSPYLGPVKNQGSCGACWAFAATTVLEYQIALKKAQITSINLSEQQLVDCSGFFFGNAGCNGGFYNGAWDYVRVAPGIALASSYPYRSANGWFCFYNFFTSAGTLTQWQWAPQNDEEKLKVTLATNGPVAVAIHVIQTFILYKGGVYNDPNCSSNPMRANHAMVLVGYGTTEEGQPYWIIRNSWSANWGIGGYALLQLGVNRCGVANWPAYVTIN